MLLDQIIDLNIFKLQLFQLDFALLKLEWAYYYSKDYYKARAPYRPHL
jgi:hypothetical protein